jgi:hypothetical protein
MAPLYIVLERSTHDLVPVPVEIKIIGVAGFTQAEVNAAFASASTYIQVERRDLCMAIPYRTTQMQDPQSDHLLYVGRELKDTLKALHSAARNAAKRLQQGKTSFFLRSGSGSTVMSKG